MRTATEAYRELVEGALRDLGSVLLIAWRVSRHEVDAQYDLDIVDGVKAVEIITAFEQMGPPVAASVQMHYRNASAHASIEVTDSGIIATERSIRDGRAVTRPEPLSDAEFHEEFASLMEMVLALELAILPWLFGHSDIEMLTATAAHTPSVRQRNQTITVLAGITGLSDITVETDGDELTMTAKPAAEPGGREWLLNALTVVAATFDTASGLSRTTLTLTGMGSVTFARAELATADGTIQTTAHVALAMAKWLMGTTESLLPSEVEMYLTVPIADHHNQTALLASTDASGALADLRLVQARLDAVVPPEQRPADLKTVVEQAAITIEFFEALTDTDRVVTPAELEELARRALGAFKAVEATVSRIRAGRTASPDRRTAG
jgi:hypothetical protein